MSSCEKELDITYHDIEPLTVIEGELSSAGAKIGITMTTPMDEPMNRTRITDATVTVDDLTDGTTFALTADDEGFYTNRTAGITGHDYRLGVIRDGNIYEAVTPMFSATVIHSLEFSWIKMPYDHVAVLQVRFGDNPDINGQCYWIKIFRNGKIYRWSELDDRSAEDGVLAYTVMTTRRDTDKEDDEDVLHDGDVVSCTVCPISREMHDYLEALQNDSNGPAMFSGDRVLGYFMASTPAYGETIFHPELIR